MGGLEAVGLTESLTERIDMFRQRAQHLPVTLQIPWYMTWLLYGKGNIFKILHTNFIFREIILGNRSIAHIFQTKIGSVGI